MNHFINSPPTLVALNAVRYLRGRSVGVGSSGTDCICGGSDGSCASGNGDTSGDDDVSGAGYDSWQWW